MNVAITCSLAVFECLSHIFAATVAASDSMRESLILALASHVNFDLLCQVEF